MIFPSPKPRRKAKSKPTGLKRSRMKQRPNKVPRDRERMAFIKTQPCVICMKIGREQRAKSQADHIKTRGAGGKEIANLWPLCPSHHDERHRVGPTSFEYRYNVNAQEWADHFERRFQGSGEVWNYLRIGGETPA